MNLDNLTIEIETWGRLVKYNKNISKEINIIGYELSYKECLNSKNRELHEYLDNSGVYILIRNNEAIYVGKANSVFNRGGYQHTKDDKANKWDKAILITKCKKNGYTNDIQEALEWMLISKVTENGIKLLNETVGNNSNATLVYDENKQSIDETFQYIVEITNKFGYSFLNKKDKSLKCENNIEGTETNLISFKSKVDAIVTPEDLADKMIQQLPEEAFGLNSKILCFIKDSRFVEKVFERCMQNQELIDSYRKSFHREEYIRTQKLYGIVQKEIDSEYKEEVLAKTHKFIADTNLIEVKTEGLKKWREQFKLSEEELVEAYIGVIDNLFKEKNGDFEMNIDYIIGNPPYQEDTGGGKSGGTAIWHIFVDLAVKVAKKDVVIITPSRWFTGGQGISDEWRQKWLNDNRINLLVHFPDASQVFPNVGIVGGVSYFRHSKKIENFGEKDLSKNMIQYFNEGTQTGEIRQLNLDTVFTATLETERESIIRKVKKYCLDNNIDVIKNGYYGEHYAAYIHSVTPVNADNYTHGEIDCLYLKNKVPTIGKIEKEKIKDTDSQNTYRVVVGCTGSSESELNNKVLSNIDVIKPGVVHNNSFITLEFDGREETCRNVADYLKCKLPRLLILHVSASTLSRAVSSYRLVPHLDFNRTYTDKDLYKIFNLTQEEINYIEQKIKEYN